MHQQPNREELEALSESLRTVLSQECDSRSVHRFFDEQDGLDEKLWQLGAEQGWLGIGLPERFGGLGLGPVGLDVLHRHLGRFMAPGPFIATLAAAQWLAEIASDSLNERILGSVIAGRRGIATPLVSAGTQIALQNGRVTGTTGPMLSPRAPGLVVVPVCSQGEVGFALVEFAAAHASFVRRDLWDRTRCVGRFTFEGAPPLELMSDPGGSAAVALRRYLALAVAGDCVGGSRALVEATVEFLKTRVQFDRPLASFQALKHRVANLMAAVIRAEEMLEQAVEAGAQADPSAGMWADLAKAAAGEIFHSVAEDCLQLHGGIGFTWESDCHIFLKRALLNREIAGSAAVLRDQAASAFTQATLEGRSTAELSL